jgi:hypothetical protein
LTAEEQCIIGKDSFPQDIKIMPSPIIASFQGIGGTANALGYAIIPTYSLHGIEFFEEILGEYFPDVAASNSRISSLNLSDIQGTQIPISEEKIRYQIGFKIL